jgi:hypothetical protein
MRSFRLSAVLTRRPRPAVIALAGLATTVAALVATLGTTYSGANEGATLGPAGCFVGVEWRGETGVYGSCTGTDPDAAPQPAHTVTITAPADDDVVTAYNAGWKAGVDALGHGTHPTYPDVVGDANDAGTVAWADGWIDGQADALGDDNRDGQVEEDESGWDCHRMGNRVCGPQRDASHTSR